MDLKTLLEETKEGVLNRVNDSLIGTFITSFLIVNWKIFFYATEDASADHKVEQIINTVKTCGGYGIWMPLVITSLYIGVYPFLRTWVKKIIVWHLLREKGVMSAIEFEEKKNELQEKIDGLQAQLKKQQENNKTIANKNQQMNKVSTNLIAEMTGLFTHFGNVYSKDDGFKNNFNSRFPKVVQNLVAFFVSSSQENNAPLKDLAALVNSVHRHGFPLTNIDSNTLKNLGIYSEEQTN